MSYQAIKEYLAAVSGRYRKVKKSEKSRLLTDAVQWTGLTRKHLIGLLNRPKDDILAKKKSGRPKAYSSELLLPHIQFLWISMERISARRMKVGLADWLPFYQAATFTQDVRLALERMSVSTLERFLREIRRNQTVTRGLSTTSPARYMKNKVPINTLDAKIDRPGHFQADTVSHCGNSGTGPFISSVTMTDIFSGWTENRAMPSKQGHEVRKCLTSIERHLPFSIVAINTDSGSEFLNTPILEYTQHAFGGHRIHFTRSRPYKKNDNCYVEQKNFTHVRELFGYERFEDPKLVRLMNVIYQDYWNPLQNYFLPTFKLKEKTQIGARIVKKFEIPQTPYDRLHKSTHLNQEEKLKLQEMKKGLNPFTLKSELEIKLKEFFDELRKTKTREAA